MSNAKLLSKSILPLILFISLTGCSKKDADKIGEAQDCLDTATAATVNACLQKVEGLTSPQSYVIRCAASFISEGFDTPTKLSNAYTNMNNTGGASASQSAMTALAFSSVTASNTNLSYCSKSESKGLQLLSGIANMATNIMLLANSCSTVDATCITAAQSNSAVQAAVGAAALVAYQSNCTNGQNTNQQFCSQFSTAVSNSGSTDATCVGKNMLAVLNGSTAAVACP